MKTYITVLWHVIENHSISRKFTIRSKVGDDGKGVFDPALDFNHKERPEVIQLPV